MHGPPSGVVVTHRFPRSHPLLRPAARPCARSQAATAIEEKRRGEVRKTRQPAAGSSDVEMRRRGRKGSAMGHFGHASRIGRSPCQSRGMERALHAQDACCARGSPVGLEQVNAPARRGRSDTDAAADAGDVRHHDVADAALAGLLRARASADIGLDFHLASPVWSFGGASPAQCRRYRPESPSGCTGLISSSFQPRP